jgi:hypothetical protein
MTTPAARTASMKRRSGVVEDYRARRGVVGVPIDGLLA